jgi:hypothetical protein
MRQYWMCKFHLDGQQRFFIWYTDEKDGVVVDANSQLVTFESDFNAAHFARLREISLEDDVPTFFDLEQVSIWCKSPNAEVVDCKRFLDAWNLFDDISSSCNEPTITFDQVSNRENDLYNKLFFGNNLPSITPAGEHYEPEWTEEEIKRLHEVLNLGLHELRHRLTQEAV